jgi:hypothetical protein
MLTEAERSMLHSKKILLANRREVLAQLLKEVAKECETIRQLENLIEQLQTEYRDGLVLSDNDLGEITVRFGGGELRGWNYVTEAERQIKMMAAREYVEGWCNAHAAVAGTLIR